MTPLEVRANLNKTVLFSDMTNIAQEREFHLSGCMVRKNQDGFLEYFAELEDMNRRSVIIARLEKVKLKE